MGLSLNPWFFSLCELSVKLSTFIVRYNNNGRLCRIKLNRLGLNSESDSPLCKVKHPRNVQTPNGRGHLPRGVHDVESPEARSVGGTPRQGTNAQGKNLAANVEFPRSVDQSKIRDRREEKLFRREVTTRDESFRWRGRKLSSEERCRTRAFPYECEWVCRVSYAAPTDGRSSLSAPSGPARRSSCPLIDGRSHPLREPRPCGTGAFSRNVYKRPAAHRMRTRAAPGVNVEGINLCTDGKPDTLHYASTPARKARRVRGCRGDPRHRMILSGMRQLPSVKAGIYGRHVGGPCGLFCVVTRWRAGGPGAGICGNSWELMQEYHHILSYRAISFGALLRAGMG
jgi:hypothetical protein